MSNFVNKLRELNVADDDLVTLSYSEGNDVWHINESHVEDSVSETDTASLLAGLLTSGIPVFSGWGEVTKGNDILNEMRDNGHLDDYERDDDYRSFDEYVAGVLRETIYDGEYSLEYSTEQYDYKRGRCDISTEVRVRAGDIIGADTDSDANSRFRFFSADSFVAGFEVSVETKNGTLTLR